MRRSFRAISLLALMPLLCGAPAFGQAEVSEPETGIGTDAGPDAPSPGGEENLEELFDAPQADTVLEDVAVDHKREFDRNDGIVLTGSFSATMGLALGWKDAAIWAGDLSGMDKDLGLISSNVLYMDARPSESFRVFGSCVTAFNPSTNALTWPTFSISELFCDYILANAFFIRIGKFGNSWGQGRLFTPGNLSARTDGMFAMRVSVPTVLKGVNAIAAVDSQDLPSAGEGPSLPYKMIYAAKADMSFKGIYLGTALRYQALEGVSGLLSLKRIVFGADLYCDAIGVYGPGRDASAYSFSMKTVAGAYKDWKDIALTVEYEYDQTTGFANDHRLGAAIGFNNLGGTSFDLGLRVFHALADNSGSFLALLKFRPFEYVEASIALPLVYGKPGSVFVLSDGNDVMTGYRLGLGLGVKLSGGY